MEQLDKRDRILRATIELIAENGFNGSPTAQIAKMASVAEGTIYRYFENKDVLIQEAYKDCETSMLAFVSEGYSCDAPIRDRFFYIAKRFVQFNTANIPVYTFIVQFYYSSPYSSAVRIAKYSAGAEKNDFFNILFKEGIAHKIIKNLPYNVLFNLSIRPLVATVRDLNDGFIEKDEHIIDAVICACWDSIKL